METGDEGMLVSINKNENLDQIRQAFKNAKEVGMETVGFFIIGLPGDTEETIERTIRFAIELDPLVANFSMMTPYPGTLAYEQIKQRRRHDSAQETGTTTCSSRARRATRWARLTAEVQERKFKEAYRRFYLRPSRIWTDADAQVDLAATSRARRAWRSRSFSPRPPKTS